MLKKSPRRGTAGFGGFVCRHYQTADVGMTKLRRVSLFVNRF